MWASFPPSDTWLSFIACAAFEATLLFLCYHAQGPELAKRGPSIVGRWLKPKVNDAGAAPLKINPPSSVAQSWKLGALHERFFRGVRAGEGSTLREAGAVLGVGRPLTEEEFVSLARVSERAAYRSRCCGSLSDLLFVAGISGAIATIGPAVYYLTTPIHSQLAETITATVDVLRATPLCLLCLLTLVISMAFVCDGFRAADESIGGRIALTGVAGAVASMYFSTMTQPWRESELGQPIVLLGFSAAALAPVAVKFDLSLAGFLAVVSFFHCAAFIAFPYTTTWMNPYMVGCLGVHCLLGLAVCLRLKPFCSGIMAMGVSAAHITLFVNSFLYNDEFWLGSRYSSARDRNIWPHLAVQLMVYSGLLAGWFLGKSIGCDGLTNNTRLFGAVYVFATIISLSYHLPGYGGASVGWAIVFLALWRVGLYLHGHRDFVSTLWTLDAGLLRCGCGWGSNDGSGNDDGFDRPSVELLLDEGPVFESEMGVPRRMEKNPRSCSDASSQLFRSRNVASYGVLS